MTVADVAFYSYASVLIAAALLVTVSRNPVHSVLWLILAFLNAAGLFVLLGAEFIAMLLIIVYVGAVAVLFLFVVMMLDVDFAKLKGEMARYMPLALLIGVILLIQFGLAFGAWQQAEGARALNLAPRPDPDQIENTRALGMLIYDKYLYLFQAAGLILLVAMIGAIVLTLRHKTGVKRQVIADQVGRSETVELHKVEPGRGV